MISVAYTSGRWLNRDELELSSRHIVLDFSALGDKAISLCPRATKIVKCEKREGGFNRVFLLTMDTGSCVVAKLPTSIAGPPRLRNNSEVATITYCEADLHASFLEMRLICSLIGVASVVQSKISLPIPKILDWNDDPSNPIGTVYIIQEHAVGVQLHQVWPEMNSEQHMLCTKMLSLAIRDMVSLGFPAYGSLYFSNGPLEPNVKVPFDPGFCIGPHCSPVFWNRSPGELELYGGPSSNCGPCQFTILYLNKQF